MNECETLLQITTNCLNQHHKLVSDIQWIGTADGKSILSWETFAALAGKVRREKDSYRSLIPANLVIVGHGWWLERWEYDGYDVWKFKEMPLLDQDAKPYPRKWLDNMK
jgi:hypothetical protein